ncbi:DUF359 domain-containing protein [Candidatus Micrarchaeota archaeon]|nr:DUF359 domain-containing protein [Candidatus Micrarchaeota archaeon]
MLERGGGVLVDGEEDLTALAFILHAKAHDIVVYGQPHKGMVIVKPDKKLKDRVSEWLGRKNETKKATVNKKIKKNR